MSKKKIAILTTARSDFGLMKPVVHHALEKFEVDLLVAGSHFLESRGNSILEIEKEFNQSKGINIVHFRSMSEGESALCQMETISNTQLLASKWFSENYCDLLLFLGDRWDLFGVTLPAFMHGIPLAHISGGEITEGIIDDAIRHSHTKISNLHFVATNEFAKNISLMGEEDWRISVVGECGLDLIHLADVAGKDEIEKLFKIDLEKKLILVTFHPSTLDFDTPLSAQLENILSALAHYSDYQIIFTSPGVEQGSEKIIEEIQKFTAKNINAHYIHHFGSRNYLALLRAAKLVIGNSSSGLVEAPSYGVPAINVGLRQKNRLSAKSVQHVTYDEGEIANAINLALTENFQIFSKSCLNPYDPYADGKNSLRIITAIDNALNLYERKTLRMKKFTNQVVPIEWNSLIKIGINLE